MSAVHGCAVEPRFWVRPFSLHLLSPWPVNIGEPYILGGSSDVRRPKLRMPRLDSEIPMPWFSGVSSNIWSCCVAFYHVGMKKMGTPTWITWTIPGLSAIISRTWLVAFFTSMNSCSWHPCIIPNLLYIHTNQVLAKRMWSHAHPPVQRTSVFDPERRG